jgi:hemoglobin-like flavoprotein
MTTRQIELIRSTWQMVAGDPVAVGTLFYDRLFFIAPPLRAMFRAPIAEQSRKLLSMIGYVISKLDSLEHIIDEIGKLAKRHAGYGVQEEHYTLVGDALLWTLEKGLGHHWNEEVKTAWVTCYGILSGAMISASKENPDEATSL